MRVVEVGKRVNDVMGLMNALKGAIPPFKVVNVAAVAGGTRIYLDESEERDPDYLVGLWQDMANLSARSTSPVGWDDVPEALADGKDRHVVVVKKLSPEGAGFLPGEEALYVTVSAKVEVLDRNPRMSGGVAAFEVGPSKEPLDLEATVVDPNGRMRPVKAKLRFVAPPPEPPKLPDGEPAPQPGPVMRFVSKVVEATKVRVMSEVDSVPPPPEEGMRSFWASVEGFFSRMFGRIRAEMDSGKEPGEPVGLPEPPDGGKGDKWPV